MLQTYFMANNNYKGNDGLSLGLFYVFYCGNREQRSPILVLLGRRATFPILCFLQVERRSLSKIVREWRFLAFSQEITTDVNIIALSVDQSNLYNILLVPDKFKIC